MSNEKREFSKLRSIFWPIYNEELRKFIPLALIFFITSVMYSLLRALKDTYIFNSTKSAAETFAFLKSSGVILAAIVLTIIYNTLSFKVGREKLYYIFIGSFLSFFFIFFILILPNMDYLKIEKFKQLNLAFPRFKGFWEMLRNWPLSLFYVMAESFGTFAVSVLFWTFANEITNVKQSKRFYSFLAIAANIGLIVSGLILNYTNTNDRVLLPLIISLGLLLLIVYYYFNIDIKNNQGLYQIEKKEKKKKVNLSLGESVKYLMKSKYLLLIAVLVICYGAVINLLEGVYKNEIKKFSDLGGASAAHKAISDIYSSQNIVLGIISIFMSLFVSSSVFKRGWRYASLVTPVVASVMSTLFFGFMLFGDYFRGIVEYMGTTPLFIGIVLGLIQVVFIKASKYSLFDPAKEAAYVPLDEEAKIRGKAAVDGIGGRLGKSLGSFSTSFLFAPLFGAGEIENAKQSIAISVMLFLILWIWAVNSLADEYEKVTSQKES